MKASTPAEVTATDPLFSRTACWGGIALLLGLTVLTFIDALASGSQILSKSGLDLFTQYYYWRRFGFEELANGNLALWNPYVVGGVPFFGGFQAALLYPPNWLHLILPIGPAINLNIALHVFLMGLFTYLWVWRRGLSMPACLLAGVMMMFGGPYFLHIFAGHLSNLCVMPWVPAVLLCIDEVFKRRTIHWCLAGVAALTMLLLAGHPQYVFYSAITCAIYSAFCFIRAEQRGKVTALLAAMCIGAVLISAVQLFAGMDAAGESVRAGDIPFDFAAMFSFPPENFLTFIAPDLFGSFRDQHPYWGRCYLWEMSVFVSMTGFLLSVYGGIKGDDKFVRHSIWMVLILLILSLGVHTPLFRVLYNAVPGFNKFRGNSKFTFQAILFVAMLAAVGLDAVIRSRKWDWKLLAMSATVALVSGIAAVATASAASSMQTWFHQLMLAVQSTKELYLFPPDAYQHPQFVQMAADGASTSLWMAFLTALVITGLLVWMKYERRAAYGLVLLAIVELFIFARAQRPTFDATPLNHSQMKAFFQQNAGDYRVLNLVPGGGNAGMVTRVGDLWGHDPGVLKRYAQFMTASQGGDPAGATQYVSFRQPASIYSMLRLQFIFAPQEGGKMGVMKAQDPMPRLHLVRDVRVMTQRNDILMTVLNPSFNPRTTVVLEAQPVPAPDAAGAGGTARIVDESTDHMTIEADLPSPAVLLVTEVYSKGWRATALQGSSQQQYDVIPANYTLRAIPLSAGRHNLRLEYVPTAFVVGKWVSVVGLLLYAAAWVGWLLVIRPRAGEPVTAVKA